MTIQSVSPPSQRKILATIMDVEVDQRIAHLQDSRGWGTMAMFRQGGALFQIPKAGELWLIQRIGYTWHLEAKLDSPEEHELLSELNPGDGRISLDGSLALDVDGASINSQPFGATTRDVFYPSGWITSITLTTQPVHVHTVMVFAGGLLIDPNNFILSGQTVTFAYPLLVETLVAYYQNMANMTFDAGSGMAVAAPSGVDTLSP